MNVLSSNGTKPIELKAIPKVIILDEVPPYMTDIYRPLSDSAEMEFQCRIDGDTLAKLTGATTEGMLFDVTYASPRQVQVRKHKKKRINKKWAKRYGYKTVLVEHELTNCSITYSGIHTEQDLGISGTLVR